jgi:hypothetical protein
MRVSSRHLVMETKTCDQVTGTPLRPEIWHEKCTNAPETVRAGALPGDATTWQRHATNSLRGERIIPMQSIPHGAPVFRADVTTRLLCTLEVFAGEAVEA